MIKQDLILNKLSTYRTSSVNITNYGNFTFLSLFNSIQDYWEAKKTCNNHEGNLLTIKSEETSQELSFILEIFYKAEEDHSFWIGLNDKFLFFF